MIINVSERKLRNGDLYYLIETAEKWVNYDINYTDNYITFYYKNNIFKETVQFEQLKPRKTLLQKLFRKNYVKYCIYDKQNKDQIYLYVHKIPLKDIKYPKSKQII